MGAGAQGRVAHGERIAMTARFVHRCTHVLDKKRTIAFYREALGFEVVRESGPDDGTRITIRIPRNGKEITQRADLHKRPSLICH